MASGGRLESCAWPMDAMLRPSSGSRRCRRASPARQVLHLIPDPQRLGLALGADQGDRTGVHVDDFLTALTGARSVNVSVSPTPNMRETCAHADDSGGTSAAETKPDIKYLVIQLRPTRPSHTQQIFKELENFFEAAADNPFETEIKAFRDITELISLYEAAKDLKRREVKRKKAQQTLTEKSDSVELDPKNEHYKVAFRNITTLVNRLRAAREMDKAGDKYRAAIPVRESIPNLLQNVGVRLKEIERRGAPRRFQRIFSRE